MTDTTTKAFIKAHLNDDTRQLALQASRFPEIDMGHAINQIAGWQKARHKLSSWTKIEDIVYPPPLSMEQCSSERTAIYKAKLCQRLLHECLAEDKETSLIDITGGFGVDFTFMAKEFHKAVYIERQQALCDIVNHNLPLLGLRNARVLKGDAMDLLHEMPVCSVIYADPARRDSHGGRTYAISDCTPDILSAESTLLRKSSMVIIKLSPMLDIQKTINDLQRQQPDVVREIHVVASDNECKELLIVLSNQQIPKRIYCANNNDNLSLTMEEWGDHHPLPITTEDSIYTYPYLYEPNAAIMKAGCFHALTTRYQLKALSASSHLFLSTTFHDHFPGRKFRISAISTLNKREIRQKLSGITHANITTRNFPMTATQLRKRLKLNDGGTHYIFATTTATCTHLLFICTKM